MNVDGWVRNWLHWLQPEPSCGQKGETVIRASVCQVMSARPILTRIFKLLFPSFMMNRIIHLSRFKEIYTRQHQTSSSTVQMWKKNNICTSHYHMKQCPLMLRGDGQPIAGTMRDPIISQSLSSDQMVSGHIPSHECNDQPAIVLRISANEKHAQCTKCVL